MDYKDRKDRKHRDENGHGGHNRHGNDHRRTETNTASAADPQSDVLMAMVFKPVKEVLKKIKTTTKSAIPDAQTRANELRALLTQIGNFITDRLAELDDVEHPDAVEKRLWYVQKTPCIFCRS
jgi:hypothetical protein